ncbi:ABC-type multidrug/protein/lipid transport system, ATPase component [Lentisphaera araneosa HTCC2155]|uniref:ABC-type multidrug/protein/lipid transport system, ATPase component n=2 Tax=Lentisphaera TaxID=256846 RepID=A6DU43_9BACT|nr:ABC-type multidrug/protein/lipid transport system, ATPase component [Lentisphaera araneosa HTCC2155]
MAYIALMKNYPNVRRFLKEYPPKKLSIYFWGILCLIVTIVIHSSIPLITGRLISALEDQAFPLNTATKDELSHVATYLLLAAVGLIIFRTLSRVLIFIPGRQIESEVRESMYQSLLQLPPSSQWTSGDLISTGTNDVTSVRVMISMGVLHVINTFGMICFCLYHMLNLSVRLSLYSLIPLILVVPLTKVISNKMMATGRKNQKLLGNLTEVIREHFRAHALMAVFPVYNSIIKRVDKANTDYANTAEKFMTLRVFIMFMVSLVTGIGIYILLRYGLIKNDLIDQTAGIATVVSFMLYLWVIQGPLRAAGFLLPLLQRGEISLERLYKVQDAAKEAQVIEEARLIHSREEFDKRSQDSEPFIEIKDLHFAYNKKHDNEFKFELNIDSLVIEKGKKYGFFGSTGSGKTTLINIISGMLDVEKNKLSLQGIDRCDIQQKVLTELFSQVSQECRHFGKTIRENIEMVETNSPEKGQRLGFEDALAVSCLSPDLDKLSQGIDTLLGEHGINLSGGQKQRLSILRSLVRKAELVIMDDFISAVDHATEVKIIERLYESTKDKTLLLISHRISALKNCDKIFLLEAGKIIDSGTHEELLKSNTSYASVSEYQEKSDVLAQIEEAQS